jgi:hypothetical protein
MTVRSRLFQTGCVLSLSIGSFLAAVPNQRVWDDDKILGSRLAPAAVNSALQLWREPYWNGDPPDGYRPLGLTLLYAERRIFGDAMIGFRLVSSFIHGVVGLVLLRVLRKIVPEPVAWLSSVLFATHPVHAEAVAMAYGQLELLAALFALLAIDRYLDAAGPFDNTPQQTTAAAHSPSFFGKRTFGATLLAGLAFAFASACSKESGLMVPGLLILLRGFYLKPSDHWTTRWCTVRETAFILPGIVYLALRYAALGGLLAPPESTITYGYSVAFRTKAVIVSLGNALRLSIFPAKQTLYYGHLRDHIVNVPWTELAWIAAAAVLCCGLARQIGKNAVMFAVGWFLIAVFPVLNIVPCGVLVAERNLYLASAAITFLAAGVAHRIVWNRITYVAAATLLALCVIHSNVVARRWRDNETVWQTTVDSYPTSPMAHAGLGHALLEQVGRESDAQKSFERALQLNPNVIGGKHGMARVAMRRGDYMTALAWFEQAQKAESSPALISEMNECKLRIAAQP